MANPITSIMNPRLDRVLVYSITPQQQLALSQTPLAASLTQLDYSSNDTPKGNHATNQCISAVYLRGLPTVFGKVLVVKVEVDPNDETKTIQTKKYVISQLSPITNIVAKDHDDQSKTSTDLPGFAAVSDGADTAWFYYLRKPSDNASPVLMEAKLGFDSVAIRQVVDVPDNMMPGEKSRLSAVCFAESNKCQVFFQVKQNGDNKIHYITTGEDSSPTAIPDTQSALDGTPIATVLTGEGHIHVYWMNTQGDIQRSTSTTKGQWSTTVPKLTPNDKRLQKESQITVTHVVTGSSRQNLLWFIVDKATKYSMHADPL